MTRSLPFPIPTRLLAVLLLSLVAITPVHGADPRPGVLSPRVEARLAADPGGREALWIFFTDKGFPDAASERAAIARLPRPAETRRPARRHEPNRLDLPVAGRYLDQVVARGATIRHPSRWLNAVSVELDLEDVPQVAALPFVKRIEIVRRSRRLEPVPDREAGVLEPPADDSGGLSEPHGSTGPGLSPMTSYPAEEALHYGASFNQNNQIGIVGLHRLGYTGAGVVLAILDTGFKTTHPATLGRRLIAERDFVFQDNDVDNEVEDVPAAWDHGTRAWSNVAGLKAGALVGGAFEATIILAKTEDIRSETPIEEDNYVAALEWADSLGADVVSASLTYRDFDGTVNDYTYSDLNGDTCVTTIGVDIAVSRGIAVVNAMGNSGSSPGSLQAPADADSVIGVGAVDSMGTIALFSSRGPTFDGRLKPEVVARGVLNYVAVAATNGYGASNGTSFATPMTAGAAVLLIEAHPAWTGYQVRSALMSTASQSGSPDNNKGHGIVNALAAANTAPISVPLVSLPFALIAPSRGSTVTTAAPEMRWERSLPGGPGDQISYRVALATNAAFTSADTFSAGADTTFIAPMYLIPGTTYHWTVLAENNAGWVRAAYMPSRFTVDATVDAGPAAPITTEARLVEARPNPVTSGSARISFRLPELSGGASAAYTIRVFDAQGRGVRNVEEGSWGPAARAAEAVWDGRNNSGEALGAGIYFVSLEALGRRSTLKVVLAR